MVVEMVLNDLSIKEPAADVLTACQWMDMFINTIRTATSNGVDKIIRTHEGFPESLLAPNYPLRKWFNDGTVDKEKRRFILNLATKSPFWADLATLEQAVQIREFLYQEDPALGLGVTFLISGIAISLDYDRWQTSQIEILVHSFNEDEEIVENSVFINHASIPDHLLAHIPWIHERIRKSVNGPNDLWERRSELLRNLQFCENVHIQIVDMPEVMFYPVLDRLSELQEYCRTWVSGGFDPHQLPSMATPETASTLQQYGRQRTFGCPDGEERTFSWHVRLTPLAWRVHFFPLPDQKNLIIGYIGPHLPTARFN